MRFRKLINYIELFSQCFFFFIVRTCGSMPEQYEVSASCRKGYLRFYQEAHQSW